MAVPAHWLEGRHENDLFQLRDRLLNRHVAVERRRSLSLYEAVEATVSKRGH